MIGETLGRAGLNPGQPGIGRGHAPSEQRLASDPVQDGVVVGGIRSVARLHGLAVAVTRGRQGSANLGWVGEDEGESLVGTSEQGETLAGLADLEKEPEPGDGVVDGCPRSGLLPPAGFQVGPLLDLAQAHPGCAAGSSQGTLIVRGGLIEIAELAVCFGEGSQDISARKPLRWTVLQQARKTRGLSPFRFEGGPLGDRVQLVDDLLRGHESERLFGVSLTPRPA